MLMIRQSHAQVQVENNFLEQVRGAESSLNAVLEHLRGAAPANAGTSASLVNTHLSGPDAMDTIKSEDGSYLRTTSDDNGFWAVCGKKGQCTEDFLSPEGSSSSHFVRCCSDSPKERWAEYDNCPWAESNMEGEPGHAWDEGCPGEMNYYDASNYCIEFGGRLCTKTELSDDCAAGTGCDFDSEYVWALNSETFGSMNIEQNDIVCGTDGCENQVLSVPSNTKNSVRCCSDTEKTEWPKKEEKCPYVSNVSCVATTTYDVARAICLSEGARLCTKAELFTNCASEVGCSDTPEMVWALNHRRCEEKTCNW